MLISPIPEPENRTIFYYSYSQSKEPQNSVGNCLDPSISILKSTHRLPILFIESPLLCLSEALLSLARAAIREVHRLGPSRGLQSLLVCVV